MISVPLAALDADEDGTAVVLFEYSFWVLPTQKQNELIDEWIHVLLDARQGQEIEH